MSLLLQKTTAIFSGTLLIASISLLNGFPFLSSDSAAYIDKAFSLRASDHQPLLYSLLIRLVSLGQTLWLVVFAQCLLVAFLIHEVARVIRPTLSPVGYLFLVWALCLGTSLPWFQGQIMADALSGPWALSLFLVARGRHLLDSETGTPFRQILIVGIWVVCTLSHFSHLVATIVLLPLALIWISPRRVAALGLALSVGLAALTLVNWKTGQQFQLHRTFYSFFIGRFYEANAGKGSLNYFLWDPSSPHQQLTPEDRDEKYPTMFWEMVTQKPWQTIEIIFTGALRQTLLFGSGDALNGFGSGHPIWRQLERYPRASTIFSLSRQQGQLWSFDVINRWQTLFLILTLTWVLLSKGTDEGRKFTGFVLIVLAVNAIVCGGMTGGFYRYQGRLIWLLPLALLLSSSRKRSADSRLQSRSIPHPDSSPAR